MDSSAQSSPSALSRYFADIRDTTRLTKDEEHQLARLIQKGHKEARDELVTSNLSFVVKVASEYRNLGIPFEDLLNEGNLGLIEAANRFDVSKDTKFISYAVWWIRKTILKALADHANTVRIPTHQMKKVREIRQAEAALHRELGRKPRREEISRTLERDVSKVDEVLQISLHGVSLDEKVGKNEDRPLSEFLEDRDAKEIEEGIIHREETHDLGDALGELSDQEHYVVSRRFGLNGSPTMTLQEIGKTMGVSRERVRQIENKAKRVLLRYFKRRNSVASPSRDRLPSMKMGRRSIH